MWLIGDQLYWIFSIYSTNVLRRLFLLWKSLSICYMETWNAVAVKMKCYSGNTYVITLAESPLQWNGCCLATNAREEPAEFSIFPPAPGGRVWNVYHHTGGVTGWFSLKRGRVRRMTMRSLSSSMRYRFGMLASGGVQLCSSQWTTEIKSVKLTRGKYWEPSFQRAVCWREGNMRLQMQNPGWAWQCLWLACGFRAGAYGHACFLNCTRVLETTPALPVWKVKLDQLCESSF